MRLRLGLFLMCLLVAVSGCSKKPGIEWERYEDGLMEQAQQGDQPILAYFYAAWCPPCYDLKDNTFSDPEVIEISQSFRRLKFDMSHKRSPRIRELHQQYRVRGLPHMILMWPGQDPSSWYRISGYASPSRFKQHLTSFLNRPRA